MRMRCVLTTPMMRLETSWWISSPAFPHAELEVGIGDDGISVRRTVLRRATSSTKSKAISSSQRSASRAVSEPFEQPGSLAAGTAHLAGSPSSPRTSGAHTALVIPGSDSAAFADVLDLADAAIGRSTPRRSRRRNGRRSVPAGRNPGTAAAAMRGVCAPRAASPPPSAPARSHRFTRRARSTHRCGTRYVGRRHHQSVRATVAEQEPAEEEHGQRMVNSRVVLIDRPR